MILSLAGGKRCIPHRELYLLAFFLFMMTRLLFACVGFVGVGSFVYFCSRNIIENIYNNLGGYSSEVPPLPIPNREVKLTCADGTAVFPWESR